MPIFSAATRASDVLAGAASAGLLQRRAVVVELQRDADDFVAGMVEQGGDHGGIDPAGHGGHHARALRQACGFTRRGDAGIEIGRAQQGNGALGHRRHIGQDRGIC